MGPQRRPEAWIRRSQAMLPDRVCLVGTFVRHGPVRAWDARIHVGANRMDHDIPTSRPVRPDLVLTTHAPERPARRSRRARLVPVAHALEVRRACGRRVDGQRPGVRPDERSR
jgi:hypothetical protein